MFPLEISPLWRFLKTVEQYHPGLLLKFFLLAVVVGVFLWVILLGVFRLRGYHFLPLEFRFQPAPGIMPSWSVRFRRALTRRLIHGPPLLGGVADSWGLGPRLLAVVRWAYGLLIFGSSFNLQLGLLFLLTAYSFALSLSLLLVHWQEFSWAIEANRYIHWEWTLDQLSRRGDLEYRWWLKWFWRHSIFGTGYYRGAVRFNRGGPGPRLDPTWKPPRRNLAYWLGVRRPRRPHRNFYDWTRRVRIRLRQRHSQRWLRYLLGLCTGVVFLQMVALVAYLRDLPVIVTRFAKKRPRIGSAVGRQFAIERETRVDLVRKANLAGVILVLVVVFLVWGWGGFTFPPGTFCRPLLGGNSRLYT